MNRIFFQLFLTALVGLNAQSLSHGGFIKFDSFWNSRQVISAREGHFYLYPANKLDSSNTDLNSDPLINMVLFQSRVWLQIHGYSAFQANLTGKLEVDFFGTGTGLENNLRLRHAFIKMSWTKIEFLFGQYWSPLFTVDVFPQVVNFNTGVPFQPFARFPQISIQWKITKSLHLLGSASMQLDAFQEISGKNVQQRSGLPGFHLHSIWKQSKMLFGIGGYTKSLKPEKGGDILQSNAFTIYSKLALKHLNFRMKYISGNDLADHIMLGGYVKIDHFDKEVPSFYPTMLKSAWIDLEFLLSNTRFGLFAGYTENNGIDTHISQDDVSTFEARSSEILSVIRVSPRIVWERNSLRFALEYDRTEAHFTSEYTDFLKPKKMEEKPVANHRILFAVYLTF
ncbi:MAG: hypothetical protein HOD97_02630 [Candidatus Marinimicrobia bacterium]|jgi:hypothetical protein|nr:hypothetical protein [Candidatus Neomarinimicrobiota bacterium]MBT3617260.1 hypothetical protein [Candidatus Neomarinimicrobiota bacterium]MBT3828823.1 hypothetical protein [Candidatus Neomarinimicrobiota bacterium]MBT3997794.1 hypothetical protein [Candidatus Neomarinimicrobiota bacterium]MBT4280508.1 hypothetical protein [Candidatus Neomarinimicrobiota bacterium]